MKLVLGFVLSVLIQTTAFAGSVSIPLAEDVISKKPPADLVYQNQRVDSYEAFELQKSGVDLSKLNPYESNLWQNKKHNLIDQPIPDQSYSFDAYKTSPTEFFKAAIVGEDQARYIVTASVKNHGNILRAALLRLLGYDIVIPRYFKKLKINFTSEKDKLEFLEKVGEKTLTNRNKWISEETTETILVIKDVILEPAELNNVNIYMPIMSRSRQLDRRTFRALLAVYAITSFKQSINGNEWKIGRVFNQHLMINFPYANQFRDVTKEDLKWINQRFNQLSTKEIQKAVAMAQFPAPLNQLVSQLLISRINSLNEHLGLDSTLNFDRNINNDFLKRGKLISDLAPERVVSYFQEDADSPFDFQDLFRLYRSQAVYNILSQTLDSAINKFVPGIRIEDAAGEIQQQISDYRAEHPIQNGETLPLKLFTYPTAYAGASANRNVVFGQQFGRSAPIQLVDTVAASANLGFFSMLTGVSNKVLPGVSAQVSLTRSYTHVRPMPDLKTATSEKLKKVLVPRLMKSLGRMIDLDIACSLDNTVNVVEETLQGKKIVYIKYDKSIPDAKDQAILKRAELISQGVPEEIILLVPIDRDKECVDEIERKKSENLDKFIKEFALNETFIISDTLNMINSASATIPLEALGGIPLNLTASGDLAKGLLRNITLRKSENELEVTIQKQNNFNKSIGLSLSYFVDIIAGTRKWLEGKQKTLLYKIPLENLTAEKKTLVSHILYDLFTSNSLAKLQENFSPVTLYHDIGGRLNTLKFLWFKTEGMRLNNHVEVILPADTHPELSEQERTKKLYSTSSYRRNGRDIFGFFNNMLTRISSFIRIGQNPPDAGQAIKGSSKSRYYTTEADISDGYDPIVTSKVDYIWKGWKAKNKKLNSIFSFIEGLFGETQMNYTIDRSKFQQGGALKGYEVKMTLIVYPEFYQDFKAKILDSSYIYAARVLRYIYGEEDWDWYCEDAYATIHNTQDESMCMPGAARRLLKLRKNGFPSDKVALVNSYNSILVRLLEAFNRQRVLKWISPENMFSSTRVTGFKENTEKGYVDYISNTYGQYNREYGSGIFDQIGSVLGIAPYELRALNYTPAF